MEQLSIDLLNVLTCVYPAFTKSASLLPALIYYLCDRIGQLEKYNMKGRMLLPRAAVVNALLSLIQLSQWHVNSSLRSKITSALVLPFCICVDDPLIVRNFLTKKAGKFITVCALLMLLLMIRTIYRTQSLIFQDMTLIAGKHQKLTLFSHKTKGVKNYFLPE